MRPNLSPKIVLYLIMAVALSLGWAGITWARVYHGNTGREGETVDVRSLTEAGRITVVDFYSPFCPPCRMLAPILEELAQRDRTLTIVKLNINRPRVPGIDWKSPLAEQYRIKSVPYFMIFDAQGNLTAEGRKASKMVQDWIEKAGISLR